MEPNQLLELADNAELDHWPPHLGVTTDAEKVEYLVVQLREAVAEVEETLGKELAFMRTRAEEAEGKLKQIQELAVVK